MLRLFTKHPNAVGESYADHLRFAAAFGVRMMAGGLAALVHGVFPFLFEMTGSRTLFTLNETIRRSKQRHAKTPDFLAASHIAGSGI
jgi:Family of unknown function (DUF6356)